MKMNLNLSIFIVFCLIQQLVYSKDDYKWLPYEKKDLPDSLKKEDAIYLENRITLDFMENAQTQLVYFKRIVVNSKQGVDNCSKREFYVYNNGKVSLKKARIIKTTGEIIDVGAENIIETVEEEKLKFVTRNNKRVQFLFNGLKEGDVIDVVYQIDFDRYLLSDTYYLESDLVSLNTILTIRNTSFYELSIFPSKNMADFIASPTASIPSFTWKRGFVKKVNDGKFNAPHPNSSSVAYSLWHTDKQLTYVDVYKSDLTEYNCAFGGGSISQEMIKAKVFTNEDIKEDKLLKTIEYFTKSGFKWINESEVSDKVKTMDFFDRKVINHTLFFRYFQAFCEEIKMPYEIGYTRNLLDGVFQQGYVTFEQLDIRYLYVKDETGNGHFLFAPARSDKYYRLDEIPYYAEGNSSVLLSGDKINLKNIGMMLLPESSAKQNKHTNNVLVRLGEKSDSVFIKRNDTFTGHYSHLIKGKDQKNWLKDFAVADTSLVPTSQNAVFPFDVQFKQEKKIGYKSLFTEIDDTLVWFQPKSILPPGVYYEGENINEMGDYVILPFLVYNKFAIYVEAPYALKLAESSRPISITNDLGTLKIELIHVNEKQLKITYEIMVNKRIVSTPSEKANLDSLLTEWKNIQSKKWVLKKG